ncbi:glycosyltransferase family 4 protein [candidate division KSB1 bacterium]|nr:glycosyltransferase family 4 protein [candidate division KSB1 bacterium]
MRIGMILQADFPPDIRVEKEVETLCAAGHEVHLVCRNKQNRPPEEMVNGIQVHRLRPWRRSLRWNVWSSTPLFFNPRWYSRALQVIRQHKIEVIHVHDLPLVMLGWLLARRFQLPLVYDMHENYPAALRVWRKSGFSYYTTRNPMLAEYLDRFCQKQATRIIVVIEEQQARLAALGVPAAKLHVVSNTTDFESFRQMTIDPAVVQQFQDQYVILYIGGFSPDRDLATPILGMKDIVTAIPQALLLLVGGGDEQYQQQLQTLVATHQLQAKVHFINWVPFGKVPSYIKAARVGIVPQPNNAFINTTIPHKLFQYMALGLPVVVSDAKPLARIVNEGRGGEVFHSQSPADFAAAILRIYQSKWDYGSHGEKLVREKYNWSKTSQELLKLYRELTSWKTEGKC